ncbi:hypothetical protein ACXIUS_29380 [Bosea thiooxidans]|nr:hypothetical protein [Bosea sp. (in: a-proteobacteria)]
METVTEFSTATSLPPVISKTKVKTTRAEKAVAGTSSHPLLKEAVREIRELPHKTAEIEEKRRQVSFVALGRLHELRAAAMSDTSLMEMLEQESRIPRRKNTSDHLYVVKAVLRIAGSDLKAQTASDWAKVLRGLEQADVPVKAAQVVEWLSTPDEETDLTGHAKAFAIVERAAKDGPPNVAAEARAAKQTERKQKAWADYVTLKLATPLAEVTFAEPLAVAEGYVLQLARVEGQQAKVLDIVLTDQDEIQRLVRKHSLAA